MNFVAIDFETATASRNSACAVGIVVVENGKITDEFSTLIQPPNNKYDWQTIRVHGIKPQQTRNILRFNEIYPEIKKRLQGRVVVAHNESFDRSVLTNSMLANGIDYSDLNISDKWQCTVQIYRAKGYIKSNLKACCERNDIELNHHEALSDARACALLYLIR